MRRAASIILALSAAFFSEFCESAPSSFREGGGARIVFTAQSAPTKTAIEGGHTVWEADDRIRVFYGDGEWGYADIKEGAGTATATFEAEVPESGDYYAVYPSSASSSMPGADNLVVTLPSSQSGSFSGGHVAVAKGRDKVFRFTNVNCVLKIGIRRADYTRIVVESQSGSPLTGSVGVNFADGKVEAIAEGASASADINLMKTIPAGDLYLGILPGIVHQKGLEVKCYYGDILKRTYHIDKELATEASCILSFTEPENEPLKVTTFNIRSSDMTESSTEREWNQRRDGVYEWVNTNKPVIMCTQECQAVQRSDIVNNCTDYAMVYHYDSPDVIFYRKKELTVLSYGTFWLVEGAPTYKSKTSTQRQDRCATWMRCSYRGQRMLVIDTHLSYRTAQSPDQRSEEMQQLRFYEMGVITTWLESHYDSATDGHLLFMADYNIDPGNAIFDGWKDGTYGYYARDAAPGADTGRTFNDWGGNNKQTIDHQFFRGFTSVQSYTVDRNPYAGYTYISDHWPVTAVYGL